MNKKDWPGRRNSKGIEIGFITIWYWPLTTLFYKWLGDLLSLIEDVIGVITFGIIAINIPAILELYWRMHNKSKH